MCDFVIGSKKRWKFCGDFDCKTCHKVSFAGHERSRYWGKNNDKQPIEVNQGSHDKYQFECDKCNHIFHITPNDMISNGNACAFCSKNRLCKQLNCKFCFENSFAANEKAKFWSFENDVQPYAVRPCSNRSYWFECNVCGHNFKAKLGNITKKNQWCPYCSSRRLCDNNECILCFNKSFASSKRAKYWSPKNAIQPRNVFKQSSKSFLFTCNVCDHEFSKRLYNVTGTNRWCPFCVNQRLCDNNECATCFTKSFASHKSSVHWSVENLKTPRQVFKSTAKRYLFNCNTCSHVFSIRLYAAIAGQWCSYCTNRKLCSAENCHFCFSKSFAKHPRSQNWHKNNNKKPRDVFAKSHEMVDFVCDSNHIFKMRISHVSDGIWCPQCKNKTEQKFAQFLNTIIVGAVMREKKFDWCINIRSGRRLPFDFFIPSLNLIIELDGDQHFRQVLNWKPPEQTQQRDLYKMNCVLAHTDYSLIRIYQTDVWNDTGNWKTKLAAAIERSKTERIIYVKSSAGVYQDYVYPAGEPKKKKIKRDIRDYFL